VIAREHSGIACTIRSANITIPVGGAQRMQKSTARRPRACHLHQMGRNGGGNRELPGIRTGANQFASTRACSELPDEIRNDRSRTSRRSSTRAPSAPARW